jgi:hypothetical protein
MTRKGRWPRVGGFLLETQGVIAVLWGQFFERGQKLAGDAATPESSVKPKT